MFMSWLQMRKKKVQTPDAGVWTSWPFSVLDHLSDSTFHLAREFKRFTGATP
jgi:hypothetical protein